MNWFNNFDWVKLNLNTSDYLREKRIILFSPASARCGDQNVTLEQVVGTFDQRSLHFGKTTCTRHEPLRPSFCFLFFIFYFVSSTCLCHSLVTGLVKLCLNSHKNLDYSLQDELTFFFLPLNNMFKFLFGTQKIIIWTKN